eukprot:4418994-Alexandrium_andersonii.AAC.1
MARQCIALPFVAVQRVALHCASCTHAYVHTDMIAHMHTRIMSRYATLHCIALYYTALPRIAVA